MKILFSAIVLLFFTQNIFSQILITQAKSIATKEWGYINLKGEFIIAPKYKKCFEFTSEGYAPVYDEKAREHQFINSKGEKLPTEIKNLKLERVRILGFKGLGFAVRGFTNGLAPVRVDGKWGFINLDGKLFIKATYDKVSEFNEGFAIGTKGNEHFILNMDGSIITISDPSVKTVAIPFSEGLTPFDNDINKGFIDTKGKVVIEPKFCSVGHFSHGLAWAKTENGKVGYIDKTGQWVIQPEFDVAHNFDPVSELARIKKTEKWGYVDKTGKIYHLNDSETFDDFVEGLCVGRKETRFGFYDKTGKWVIEPRFEAVHDFKNGYAAARWNAMWGMIDTKGAWVIQPQFAAIKDMELVK